MSSVMQANCKDHPKMKILEQFGEVFWSPSFWLPPNSTWEEFEHFENKDGHRIPDIQDLFFAWKFIPVILLIKYLIEKRVGVKVAEWAGIKQRRRERPPIVDILEKAHHAKPCGIWRERELYALSKRLDWPKEDVEKWIRARRRFAAPTTVEKFCESSWRFIFFICMFTYGLYAHWSKEWFWDFKLCWKNFPQPVTEDLYWYFIISLTNYSSWSISHFWDVQRKDPKIMMFHHFVTLTLLTAQWVTGFHRVGLLICLLHDVGDFWLELSKCLKYLGLVRTCQVMFVLFAVMWIITRNIIFPFYLIPCTYYHSPHNVSTSFPFSCLYGPCDISSFNFTSTHALIVVAVSLSLLHVYWTCLIFKVLYLAIFVGKLEDDTVSASDESDDDDRN